MAFEKERRKLNADLKKAIHYLHRLGFSNVEIGQAVGYPDGDQVGKVLNSPEADERYHIFNAMALRSFAVLCSEKGYHDLSDSFSAPAYRSIPSTAGEAEANLCVLEENMHATENLGHAITSYHRGKIEASRERIGRVIAACFDFQKEIDALAAMQSTRGDGSPSVIPNATVSTL